MDRAVDGTSNRGERHWRSVLTPKDIRAIRMLAKSGIRQKDLAEQFNVAGPTISNIVTGKTWSHV